VRGHAAPTHEEHESFGELDAAPLQGPAARPGPAAPEHVFPGQIDDRVGSFERLLQGTVVGHIDGLDVGPESIVRATVGADGGDDFVFAAKQPERQSASDKSSRPRHEYPHGCRSTCVVGGTKKEGG
jgi:hypothetical protein